MFSLKKLLKPKKNDEENKSVTTVQTGGSDEIGITELIENKFAESETTLLSEELPMEGETTLLSEEIPVEGETTLLSEELPMEGETTLLSEEIPMEGETTLLSEELPVEGETTVLSGSTVPTQHVSAAEFKLYIMDCSTRTKKIVDKNVYLIGKDSGNMDFVVSDKSVSRHHATILFENGSYYIMDNKSTNGTTMEGVLLSPFEKVELYDGAIISLGNFGLQIKMERR